MTHPAPEEVYYLNVVKMVDGTEAVLRWQFRSLGSTDRFPLARDPIMESRLGKVLAEAAARELQIHNASGWDTQMCDEWGV